MTAQFCGVLDLGGCADHQDRTRQMAEALAAPYQGRIAVHCDGPLSLGHTALHEEARVWTLGDDAIAGNFDLLYRAEPTGDQTLDPRNLLALLHGAPHRHVGQVDGEFAFAHWDGVRKVLTLVRDRPGTRPLYFIRSPGAWLAFASSISALRAAGFGAATLHLSTAAQIAIGNYAAGTQTLFDEVSRVLPGEALAIDHGGLIRHRYWRLECTDPIPPSASYYGAIAHMKTLLERAVRRRLPATGPAFSHLSGGLDSSAIAGLAAGILAAHQQKLVGYAFYPRPGAPLRCSIDERPEVEAICQAYPNIDLRPIDGDFYSLMRSAPVAADFPVFLDPREQYTQILADAAASGATSVFSGFGGDQGVSHHGTHAFAEMVVRGQWRTLGRLARDRTARSGRKAWRIVARDLYQTVLPRWARSLLVRLIPRLGSPPNPFHRFLKPEILSRATAGTPRQGPDTRRNRQEMLSWGHLTFVLEEIAWRAAQHGLGYTLPLLDREVLEYMIRLPGAFFVHDGRGRTVLRDAMADVLPQQVRERPFKLVPDPGKVIRVSQERASYRAVVDALRGTQAERILDLEAITAAIEQMPEPIELIARTETMARSGVQYAATDLDFLAPLVMACFIAANVNAVPESNG